MKKVFLILFFSSVYLLKNAVAQDVVGAVGADLKNISVLTPAKKSIISEELLSLTPSEYYEHPEFGINPINTPCEDCIELINERTDNTRYYVKKGTRGSYFYKQTSSEDLHYKNEKGQYISIDPNLKPTDDPNIFNALQQINYTVLNLHDGYSELELLENQSVKFNSGITLFASDKTDNSETTIPQVYQFNDHTVGDNGCEILNAWSGINIEMLYRRASIETNYTINDLSSIQTDRNYTIIDDVFSIPSNMKFIYDVYEGSMNENGLWVGEILLVDEFEREFARIGKCVVYDESETADDLNNYSFISGYKILFDGTNYHLQIYINNNYLKNPNRVFPITIDPLVSSTTSWTGTMGSEYSPAFCSMTLNVATPAGATLTNASMYWEVVGNFLGDCGAAATARCYLKWAQVYMSTSCGYSPTTFGYVWVCSGTCAVYGTWAPSVSTPTLVTCLTPQCASYNVPFTFYLNRLVCSGGSCATLCMKLQRFDVTIEGHTVEATMLTGGANLASWTITDCTTQNATFTAGAVYGVGPYTYVWTPSGGTGATDWQSFSPGTTTNVTVTVTDACGNVISDLVVVTDPCGVLPIELSSFNGYSLNGKNYLYWTTESEQNSASFKIERSFDGISFEEIGSINAAGNSTTELKYAFVDENPFPGVNYYRLKQVDLDGSFDYSKVVPIHTTTLHTNSLSLNSINTYNGQLDLTLVTEKSGAGKFVIYDMTGRVVFQKIIDIEKGVNSILLFPSIYSGGAYILSFANEDMFENIKFELE